jgi:hypothetical protein
LTPQIFCKISWTWIYSPWDWHSSIYDHVVGTEKFYKEGKTIHRIIINNNTLNLYMKKKKTKGRDVPPGGNPPNRLEVFAKREWNFKIHAWRYEQQMQHSSRLQDKWTSISLKAALTRKQTRELGHLRFQYITRHSES